MKPSRSPLEARAPDWPLVALMLPTVVLAVLATWVLARDWRAARTEAHALAQGLAVEAASRLGSLLDQVIPSQDPPGAFSLRRSVDFFHVGPSNELLSPSPSLWPPDPQPFEGDLDAAGQVRWNQARAAFEGGDWEKAAEMYESFLDAGRGSNARPSLDNDHHEGHDNEEGAPATAHPPTPGRYRDLAWYDRALALERAGRATRLTDEFEHVLEGLLATGPFEARTEAGVPVHHLAALKILDLAEGRIEALPVSWRQNPLPLAQALGASVPSPFLSTFFERIRPLLPEMLAPFPGIHPDNFLEVFERHQRGRERYAAARQRIGQWLGAGSLWPDAFWLEPPTPGSLAVRQKVPPISRSGSPDGDRFYALIADDWIRAELLAAARELDRRGDFVLRLNIADRVVTVGAGDGPVGRQEEEFAAVPRTVAGGVPFVMRISLGDPKAFFAGQRLRQWIFGSLLVAALVAATVSVRATQQALRRQYALNAQKSNFLSSVSHELRAPLGSIRLLAEGLERGTLGDEAKRREYFRLISQETRRLGALVENVLDFSRIEQGRKRYEFEPTDLVALVHGTAKLSGPVAEARGVNLEFTTVPRQGPIEIEADDRALQQALLNLLDNALKHSPAGSVIRLRIERAGGSQAESQDEVSGDAGLLQIEARPWAIPSTLTRIGIGDVSGRRADPQVIRNRSVRLSVQDQGPGIPREDHAVIFEPFYRRGSELRRDTQGVGIGLSIVKHVVDAHGGYIEVESDPGKGARFTMVFPQAAPPPGRTQSPASPFAPTPIAR